MEIYGLLLLTMLVGMLTTFGGVLLGAAAVMAMWRSAKKDELRE